ncbi:hypothetical protein M5K25_010358 [Dendrobium thyrsiflorum]|uniref:Uncharacterized protein n=1 Tax=Dendrobium thyrsiflorum TaxID=117978 RepID=A0ABD0V736_DENTH
MAMEEGGTSWKGLQDAINYSSPGVLAGGCDVCPSTSVAEGLVIEKNAGGGNVCVDSITNDLCVAGNCGDQVVGEVPAGMLVSLGDSVAGLAGPLLANCSVEQVSIPVAGVVVPVVPEVNDPSFEISGPSVVVELPSGLPPPRQVSCPVAGVFVPVVPEVVAPSFENAELSVVVDLTSGLPPSDHLCQADMVNIPITVVSNDELKSRMTWSMNNSVLVQSNWLDIDDPISTTTAADNEDFAVHIDDDLYSLMAQFSERLHGIRAL